MFKVSATKTDRACSIENASAVKVVKALRRRPRWETEACLRQVTIPASQLKAKVLQNSVLDSWQASICLDSGPSRDCHGKKEEMSLTVQIFSKTKVFLTSQDWV